LLQFPSLVIFDMDGLMFNTERLTETAWNLAAEHYGFSIDQSIITRFTGLTDSDIVKKMAEIYGAGSPVRQWREYVLKMKQQLIEKNMHLPSFKKKGLDKLLVYLKANDVQTAVASSSKKATIDRFLTATHVIDLIDYRISGDEVTNGKPDPEIFLRSCKAADSRNDRALVLEDSPAGILAAHRAGIAAIFIPDTIPENQEVDRLATKVMRDLEAVRNLLQSIRLHRTENPRKQ
jgi:HAD superfamily hydrolase (TIGR01509 family)